MTSAFQSPLEDKLPIISMMPLQTSDADSRQLLADSLRDTCLNTGFFYISDHGISDELIGEVFAASRRFFSLPETDKMKVDKAHSPANRGYESLRGQTLEPGSPPDLKEGFYIGEDIAEGDPRLSQGHFNQGMNQWPEGQPEFREVMTRYYQLMTALSTRIMNALALSLGLKEDYFADFCHEAQATLRLLHYPPQPRKPAPGEKGCGAHTDFGGITILLLDDNPGLQVWDRSAERWLDVNPIPGTFVVNLGDMIARWTNDRYHSTVHRVVNISGKERYSVPFFFTGAPSHEVRCLPCCLEEGESPKYPPTTVEAHIREMYRRTYA
ncbi:2-oxoglutarate and iron-dependent oxygenase domain-containing protein [Marinobacter sp. BGYM27]|uniref:isopenicillin N synthase family dioxygenase n=1 Tax=Marinobacter sp. BGYM27 TaxID=2975597 RepID=UPI0021A48B83|nr:2-oxoglutarate and iron-dependent oxygenase domain-containing protein [Marinobacter sp. BGYM27]MDG5499158.1 2-oxoglutarate and iron-dependent oxygenase domain-containing protein [Marinobacter sp. BGYM27]